MGANAQTTVPTFTAGQVLTADQQNQSARTGVPVFAGTTERDAAFGGTGEKTLAEGQLCYLESTNVVQYYDGAAWATVGPASAGGLVFITGAAFTAAATVSLPTNTFTATYRNYKIIYNITSGSTDITITGRLRASGSDLTGANYNTGYIGRDNGGNVLNFTDLNQTSAQLGVGISNGGINQSGFIIDLLEPQLADKTIFATQGYYQVSSSGFAGWIQGGGLYNVATAADSFTLICSTGNITGVYRVYGYADS
jgi:hypothetical protein